jgi:hypothetical protein
MKNQGVLLIGVLAIIVIVMTFLLISPDRLSILTGKQNPDKLYKELFAIQRKIPTQAGRNNFLKQSNNLTKKVDPELLDLDSQLTSCDASVDSLLSSGHTAGSSCVSGEGIKLGSIQGLYMGGQCCGAMTDTKEYHERLKKLQSYKNMPDIILDPMRTPIELAKKWIDYDNSTNLTPDEQKIYDDAFSISKEKPCCCKCWHFFVNEGIAKKMIKNSTFNSKQIADFWDASEICGT